MRIGGNCVLLIGTYSDSGMNRIDGIVVCSRIDRIAGNQCSFGKFHLSFSGTIVYHARFPQSHRLNFCHVSYSVQSLFFLKLIFCMFCYSYTGIRIEGIVPKECALGYIIKHCL